MITYKIRDKENKIYVHNMVFWNNHLYQTDSFGKFNIISDQSPYTIEREISDDVISNIFLDIMKIKDEKWWACLVDYQNVIKKHLNQKTS